MRGGKATRQAEYAAFGVSDILSKEDEIGGSFEARMEGGVDRVNHAGLGR